MRKRGASMASAHRRNRCWAREHPGQRDEAWFKREIAQKLDGFTLAEIAAVTRLSLAACSRIRAGTRVPHARHWEVLHKLVARCSAARADGRRAEEAGEVRRGSADNPKCRCLCQIIP